MNLKDVPFLLTAVGFCVLIVESSSPNYCSNFVCYYLSQINFFACMDSKETMQ